MFDAATMPLYGCSDQKWAPGNQMMRCDLITMVVSLALLALCARGVIHLQGRTVHRLSMIAAAEGSVFLFIGTTLICSRLGDF